MANQTSLKAGAVQIDITPPVGVRLSGYVARTEASLGIHDPLTAQVLYLESGANQMILFSLDLIAVDLNFTTRLRRMTTKATGVPPGNILCACIHTHSGPQGFLPEIPGLERIADAGLVELTLRKLVGAAEWAAQIKQPASPSLARLDVKGIAANRNDPTEGPFDPQLSVLRLDAENGKPLAALVNFGCHPTVMGYENRLISADFPGACRKMLRDRYPEMVMVYTNGASGDVSTRFTRRGQNFAEVERMGGILCGAIFQALETTQPLNDTTLASYTTPVHLPLRAFPSPEEADRSAAELKAKLEALRADGAPPGEIRKAVTRIEGAEGQRTMAAAYHGKRHIITQVQVLRIGEMALVGLPGEPFSRTVLQLKAASQAPVIVISYANDYRGYFPDRVSVEAGTYEALVSPYDHHAAESLAQAALNLLKEG